MAKNEYGNANGGQTYIPFQENIYVETLPFRPLERPNPELPEFEMKPEFLERGYILTMQCQHFIPDVTPEIDGLVVGQYGKRILSVGARLS